MWPRPAPESGATTCALTVQTTGVRNPDSDFNLVVSQLQPDGTTLVPIETHRNLSLDSNSAAVRAVGCQQQLHRHQGDSPTAGLTFDAARLRSQLATITFPLAPANTAIGGTVDGTTPFLLTLAGAPWATSAIW